MINNFTMNNARLLDPNSAYDIQQLSEILNQYKQDEKNHKNPIYATYNLINHADWIQEQFKLQEQKDFKIGGTFKDGELNQIFVGHKIEIAWGNHKKTNFPYWIVGLLYFKNKQWKSPSNDFLNVSNYVSMAFERQGYTKFYTVQKLPKRLIKEKNLSKYFSDEEYFRTLMFKRYIVTIENIFMSQEDLEKYQYSGIKAFLPRNILRPIMLISCTLNPFHKYEDIQCS